MRLTRRQYRLSVCAMVVISGSLVTLSFAKSWAPIKQLPYYAEISDFAEKVGFTFDTPPSSVGLIARSSTTAAAVRAPLDKTSKSGEGSEIDWLALAANVNPGSYELAGGEPKPLYDASAGWSAQSENSEDSSDSSDNGTSRGPRRGFGSAGFAGGAPSGGGSSPAGGGQSGQYPASDFGADGGLAASAATNWSSPPSAPPGLAIAPGLTSAPVNLPAVINTVVIPSSGTGQPKTAGSANGGAGQTALTQTQTTPVAVPEPASFLLMLGGGLLAGAITRRRR